MCGWRESLTSMRWAPAAATTDNLAPATLRTAWRQQAAQRQRRSSVSHYHFACSWLTATIFTVFFCLCPSSQRHPASSPYFVSRPYLHLVMKEQTLLLCHRLPISRHHSDACACGAWLLTALKQRVLALRWRHCCNAGVGVLSYTCASR